MEMKSVRVIMVCLLAVLVCGTASAADDYTLGLGLQLDYADRDLTYDNLTGAFVTQVDKAIAENATNYAETLRELYLVGTWKPADYFKLQGLIGFGDYKMKGSYYGNTAGYFPYEFKDDPKDILFGINADFRGPVADKWLLGLSVAGRLQYYRDGTNSLALPGNATNYDSDIKRWSVDVFPKVIYDFEKLDVYAGPTYTMVRATLENKIYTAGGGIIESDLDLKEDKPWGVRIGAEIPFADNFLGIIEFSGVGFTGGTASLSYVW